MSPYNPIPSDFTLEGHADHEGDLIFSLITENTPIDGQYHLLKVSSQIMSRASPVFEAMFNPRFTGRADFSLHDPLEIALPEDDYKAMTWICFALHLQDLPEGRMPLELLTRIGRSCGLGVVSGWMSGVMQLLKTRSGGSFSGMGYALLDVQTFYKASERLIYGRPIEDPDFDSDSPDGVGFSLLPVEP